MQNGIIGQSQSMLKIMSMVYDYALVTEEELLRERVSSVLRMAQVENIIEMLSFPLHWENIVHIMVSIDEIVLLRNLEEDFIIEELESTRKQLWLHTHYYAPRQDVVMAIYRTFFNALNFKSLLADSETKDHTFIYAFYNKRATDVLQLLIFGLITDMMNTQMLPIEVEGTYFLGLSKTSDSYDLQLLVDFPEGNLYMDNVVSDFDQATVKAYMIAPSVTQNTELIKRYVQSLLTIVDQEDISLVVALERIITALEKAK